MRKDNSSFIYVQKGKPCCCGLNLSFGSAHRLSKASVTLRQSQSLVFRAKNPNPTLCQFFWVGGWHFPIFDVSLNAVLQNQDSWGSLLPIARPQGCHVTSLCSIVFFWGTLSALKQSRIVGVVNWKSFDSYFMLAVKPRDFGTAYVTDFRKYQGFKSLLTPDYLF